MLSEMGSEFEGWPYCEVYLLSCHYILKCFWLLGAEVRLLLEIKVNYQRNLITVTGFRMWHL